MGHLLLSLTSTLTSCRCVLKVKCCDVALPGLASTHACFSALFSPPSLMRGLVRRRIPRLLSARNCSLGPLSEYRYRNIGIPLPSLNVLSLLCKLGRLAPIPYRSLFCAPAYTCPRLRIASIPRTTGGGEFHDMRNSVLLVSCLSWCWFFCDFVFAFAFRVSVCVRTCVCVFAFVLASARLRACACVH